MDAPAQVGLVLAKAKARAVPFDRAWFSALRSISPPRTGPPKLRAEINEERVLLRECKAFWRAAYENRRPTEAELARSAEQTRRRLNRLGLPEESHEIWRKLERVVGEAPG